MTTTPEELSQQDDPRAVEGLLLDLVPRQREVGLVGVGIQRDGPLQLGLGLGVLLLAAQHVGQGGVRLDLRERFRYGPMGIPAFYAGVEDLEGFAAALAALGIPGEDARTARD